MKDKLVEKLIGSDVRAFEQIVKKYGRYVFRVVMCLTEAALIFTMM